MDLFYSIQPDYRYSKISNIKSEEDTKIRDLKFLIEDCEDIYPGIDIWFKKKAVPGIISEERKAIVVYNQNTPVGSAIVRNGKHSKLCSMRIHSDHQKKGLGRLVMALIALELRHDSKTVHFTIPEDIWEEQRKFFHKYGFESDGFAEKQYRLFSQEIACSGTFRNMWSEVLNTLPIVENKIIHATGNRKPEIVLSIQPHYIEKILSGEKDIEIRRSFPSSWKGSKIVFYASSPYKEFVGEAEIGDIDQDSPTNIWQKYENNIGCSFLDYESYCIGKKKISAIKLNNIKPYKNRVSKAQLENMIEKDITSPQSYSIIRNSESLSKALSLGHLLRKFF